MARPLRLEFPGAVYHVSARGNGRQSIFKDEQDREKFLSLLGSVVERYHVLCHAYCLMGNHYHLVLETPEGNLARAMRQLNGVYGQYFGRRHQKPGHVLGGRYKARLVEKDAYLLELCRYVVLNPVRARLVEKPSDWVWSSYRATAGECSAAPFLGVDWILQVFDEKDRRSAQKRYRSFVREGLTRRVDVLGEFRHSPIVGGEEFIERMGGLFQNAIQRKEVPRVQRFATRPALAKILPGQIARNRSDSRIRQAHVDYGYTMREIADHLGIHYATVSRAIWRAEK